MDKQELYEHLVHTGMLVSPQIKAAFLKVDRGDFVRPEVSDLAYEDHPLPIGLGQSISQPSTVAFMMEQLQPRKNDVILDVGTGSGWTTALLAEIVGPRGRVYSVEILPELLEYGIFNVDRYGYENVEFRQVSRRLGLPEFSPFNKILVSAEAEDLPAILVDQLARGGTLVMPIEGSIAKIDKISDTFLEQKIFPGFAFVPLKNI